MKRSPGNKNLKAILFDFGGTLDADGDAWKERFYPIYRAAGVRWSFPEFEKHFFASDDFLTDLGLDEISSFDTVKIQVGLVLRAGGRFNEKLAGRIARKFLNDSLQSIRKKTPLLRRLSRRYKLGLVANFYGNIEVFCREAGISKYFGAIVDSKRAGCIKPDPKIFHAALKKLKVSPRQALFVGDSVKRDMKGAKALGMRHIWIKGRHPQWSAPCCPEDPVIGSILELEDHLR